MTHRILSYSVPRSILVGIFAVALIGCSGSGTQLAAERSAASVEAYFTALQALQGSETGIELGLRNFTQTYADLTADDLAERIDDVYAPSLFFNDTVHTFNDRASLKAYMTKTGANLSKSNVTIHQTIRDGQDVFVRWTMYFETSEGDDAIRSTSIGISHLRFNDEGQVVVHQDYWDSASALYAHLPLVGTVIRAAQDRLAE